MNKNEFLEILQDYLQKEFSEEEVEDILRDYEEYFIEGTIEGKTEEEIIKSLGSPKAIAKDLESEIDDKKYNKEKNTNKIHDVLKIFKIKIREVSKQAKNKVNDFFTIDLKNNSKISQNLINTILNILGIGVCVLHIIFRIIMFMVATAILVCLISTLMYLATSIVGFNIHQSIGYIIVFSSLILIGINILICQVYMFIYKREKEIKSSYNNWSSKKKMYIDAKNRLDMNKKDGDTNE